MKQGVLEGWTGEINAPGLAFITPGKELAMNRLFSFLVAAIAWVAFAVSHAATNDDSFIETVLSDTETTYLVYMREEEKLARDTYITLNEDWGLRVFSNISIAEQAHMDAMLALLNYYGIDDPVVNDAVGSFTNATLAGLYVDLVARAAASSLEALYVGAYIEETDIRDIQLAISETAQANIIAIYENLLAGSKNHLRAFVNHIEIRGEDYVAQVLDQSEVDAIMAGSEPAEFSINAGLNDAWYYPETDGQGFFITVYPDLERVSLGWFTYDTELPAEGVEANLGDPGHRWLTAAGPYSGNQAQLDISITSGGIFDSAEPLPVSIPGGTILLQFQDCNSGSLSYDIPSINRTGLIPIERVAADNIALCEALIGMAQ